LEGGVLEGCLLLGGFGWVFVYGSFWMGVC
jgi:hypothetical protein